MSETKFTPGPWKAVSFNGNSLVVTELIVHEKESIALLGTCGEKQQANARLISAAPDMYKALEHALSDIDQIDELCKIAGVHKFTIMRQEIQGVLEKARGEQ